jgi:plastocyanin
MPLPRIIFVVPGIVAGIFVPAVISNTPKPAPPNTVGMGNLDFSVNTVYVHRGQSLTFVDSSHNIHVIGPGHDGEITSDVRGDPITGFHLLTTNSVYKTPPWMTPGTYYVTCGVHPMTMNLTVVVIK